MDGKTTLIRGLMTAIHRETETAGNNLTVMAGKYQELSREMRGKLGEK